MSNDKCPSSPTAIRFQQDLQINGLSERSQESYGRAVRKLSEFLKREPDSASASENDLRNYLLFIKNDLKWSSSTINVAQQGLKKYFTITCPRTWATLKLVRARGEFKLPTVISIGEVHTFLKLVENPSQQKVDLPDRGQKPLASSEGRGTHERFFRSRDDQSCS